MYIVTRGQFITIKISPGGAAEEGRTKTRGAAGLPLPPLVPPMVEYNTTLNVLLKPIPGTKQLHPEEALLL